MKDLRDPKLLGEMLLKCHQQVRGPLSFSADAFGLLEDVKNYNANPSCIEKYGRPQDLPPTPF